MDPRQTDAKPNDPQTAAGAAGVGAAGVVGPRRYPKPPRFLKHFVMLCIRPESWADAAQLPTYVTLLPLILAIILNAIGISAHYFYRMNANLNQFVTSYDAAGHPSMELTHQGSLQMAGGSTMDSPVQINLGDWRILIDPTGKTSPDKIKTPFTWLITSNEVILVMQEDQVSRGKLIDIIPHEALPVEGATTPINKATLQDCGSYFSAFFTASAVIVSVGLTITNGLWAALVMFLICPLIILTSAGPVRQEGSDRRLLLPKRAAYRIAAAVLVPLLMVNMVLHVTGHPPYELLGGEGSFLLWVFAAAGLGFWAGLMAKRMFGPKAEARAR